MSYETNYFIKPKVRTRAIAVPSHAATNIRRAYWVFAGLSTMLIAALMTTPSVKAQVYDNRDYQRQNDAYVTVYEDCDYRGKSRDIVVGDYQNVRDLGLGNDNISSLRIPNGLEVKLFEDERFRGASATITRDVSCLNRQWDNQVSSLRVSYDERNNGRYDSRDQNHGDRNNGRDNGYDREDRDRNRNPGGEVRGRDYTKDVDRVEFSNIVLVKEDRSRWTISSYDGRNQSYTEIDRDKRVIYLRNMRSRELLELNLYSSKARMISPNGRQADYQITGVSKDSGKFARVPPREPVVTPNPNGGGVFGVINGSCFTYKAYARGGQGGLKFDAKNINQKFDDDAVTGRVCHSGSLTMEINKMDPNVDVFVEIQGRTYKFAKGEKEDLLLNTWYRKMVKLKVTG